MRIFEKFSKVFSLALVSFKFSATSGWMNVVKIFYLNFIVFKKYFDYIEEMVIDIDASLDKASAL
jgi:hypothetical protein